MVSVKSVVINNAPKGILKNKYFLYFLFFICLLGIGFLIHIQKYDYIILFLLVGLLVRCYHGNMVIVLLSALIVTVIYILFQTNKREGLENANTATTQKQTGTTTGSATGLTTASTTGSATGSTTASTTGSTTGSTPGSTTATAGTTGTKATAPTNNPGAPTNTSLQSTNVKTNDTTETFTQNNQKGPKVNYAATVQDAYTNLDKLVGSDGINQLTEQTSSLLSHQTKLVDTMKNLTPLMNQVRGLISTFEKASPTNLANPANFVNA
jgi:preprotein translocase subunit SecG